MHGVASIPITLTKPPIYDNDISSEDVDVEFERISINHEPRPLHIFKNRGWVCENIYLLLNDAFKLGNNFVNILEFWRYHRGVKYPYYDFVTTYSDERKYVFNVHFPLVTDVSKNELLELNKLSDNHFWLQTNYTNHYVQISLSQFAVLYLLTGEVCIENNPNFAWIFIFFKCTSSVSLPCGNNQEFRIIHKGWVIHIYIHKLQQSKFQFSEIF